MIESNVLISVEGLKKYFPITQGILIQREIGAVKAVDDISFKIFKGETLGLVGESGKKTNSGRTLLQLYKPTAGHVYFNDIDLTTTDARTLRQLRRKLQMIFQDPYASLNPRWTISQIVGESLRVHKILIGKKAQNERVSELLELVQLDPSHLNRYPHEFSGGQRQRIGVARALASEPDFIVCDEPISALDVSIQAQIVNLLEDLQSKFNLTYLFIAHDLSMVRHICNRVAVMYLGVIVESGERDELYDHPQHPYTKALLSAVPIPDPKATRARQRIILEGDVPSPANPPSGCRFHPRCPIAGDECKIIDPEWREISPNHWIACHKV